MIEKDTSRQLKSGVVLSYINMILGMAIPFFYTPIMLELLGQAEYGLFSLSNSVVSYLSLLSFGFGTTIVRYISKYRAEDNEDAVRRTYGFFILLYCAIAVIVFLCGFALSYNVEPLFHKGLSVAEQSKMQSLVLIMTITAALSFPLSVFTSITVVYERFIFRNFFSILSTLLLPAANLVALFLGYRSVGMAVAGLLSQLLFLPCYILFCKKKIGIRPIFGLIPKSLFWEMVCVSFYHFLASIVETLFWATDKVLLGALFNTVAVAIYNIGSTFHNMVVNLSAAISGVLMPKVTRMVYSDKDMNKLNELFIRVGRIEFIIVSLFISGYTVFGRQFIAIWAGTDYSQAYWIAIITMYPICIPLIQNTGLNIIIAQNKHKFRSILYLIIAIANVVTTYLTIPRWGIIGAALCSGISYFIGHGVIMNVYYHKKIELDVLSFWKTIVKMMWIPVLMTILGLYALKWVLLTNWASFFAGVGVYTLIFVVLMYVFIMNDYEKNLAKGIIQKLLRKKNEI